MFGYKLRGDSTSSIIRPINARSCSGLYISGYALLFIAEKTSAIGEAE
tara:strand:+ start:4318 stop:4461 length:144 start_codon:yes stop_codon:yes gene_type:complete